MSMITASFFICCITDLDQTRLIRLRIDRIQQDIGLFDTAESGCILPDHYFRLRVLAAQFLDSLLRLLDNRDLKPQPSATSAAFKPAWPAPIITTSAQEDLEVSGTGFPFLPGPPDHTSLLPASPGCPQSRSWA